MAGLSNVYMSIKSPLITEKATKLSAQNKYVFWVDKRSNRVEVKRAIEAIYKVRVAKVNIINMKGKTKRLRWNQEGRTPAWKKAIVTLREGDTIKIT